MSRYLDNAKIIDIFFYKITENREKTLNQMNGFIKKCAKYKRQP